MAVALLPAAGASRRMGRPKLLLPFGDTTIVGAVARSLREAGVRWIVVVTGPDDAALRAWARDEGADVAVNPEPAGGMLTTIWRGLDRLDETGWLREGGGPLLILPADLPLLAAATVRAVLAASALHPDSLVMPRVEGANGHPLAVPAHGVEAIRRLDPLVGLRQLRERLPLVAVEVDDPGAARDVDTPAEYAELRSSSPAASSPATPPSPGPAREE